MAVKTILTTILLLSLSVAISLPASADSTYVRLKTDRGSMVLELYPEQAPATVENFLSYVNRYYYDGLIFHRVVKDFVIQSGGLTFDLTRKETSDPVINESDNGLKNARGTIAMARYADPDSATSQFYINLGDNSNLDPADGKPGYTVFGKVIDGFDVARTIGEVAVQKQDQFLHLPVEPVQILSAREIEKP